MALRFLGDFGKLKRIGTWIGKASAKRLLGDLAHDLAIEGQRLVAEEFATGTDPSGKPWKRAKDNKAGRRMFRTGALAGSWSNTYTYKAAIVQSSSAYAGPLNFGTRSIKARRQIPGARLPSKWATALTVAFMRRLQRFQDSRPR